MSYAGISNWESRAESTGGDSVDPVAEASIEALAEQASPDVTEEDTGDVASKVDFESEFSMTDALDTQAETTTVPQSTDRSQDDNVPTTESTTTTQPQNRSASTTSTTSSTSGGGQPVTTTETGSTGQQPADPMPDLSNLGDAGSSFSFADILPGSADEDDGSGDSGGTIMGINRRTATVAGGVLGLLGLAWYAGVV